MKGQLVEGTSRGFEYVTVDVFADTPFGGNPLAVFTGADGLSEAEMQLLAAEMNLSETAFVLAPDDPLKTARVRIFHRKAEMPFAGHPLVGTAFVLGRNCDASVEHLHFELAAGPVEARLVRQGGSVVGAEIEAPQPLRVYDSTLAVEVVAECIGLEPCDIVTDVHLPTRAGVGIDFLLVEVQAASLQRAVPDLGAFRRALTMLGRKAGGRLSLLIYHRTCAGAVRARMFAPVAGTWEDPATGSAHAALGAFLLSIEGGEALSFEAVQGVEMGRPSRISVRAFTTGSGVRAAVGGSCVPMFKGVFRAD